MLRYSIKRILLALLTVLIIAAITFFAMNAIPGGPFSSEKAIDPATLAALEARYGLDKPLGEQFVNYLRNLLQGDLGVSLKTGREISDVIGESFGVSARLGLMAALIAVVAGLVLGSIAALCRGKWPDRIIIFITTLFVSVPSFVLATILLLVFCLQLKWVGVWSTSNPNYVLPVLSLAMYPMAYITRLTKSSMLSASTPITLEYLVNESSGHIAIAECIQQDLAAVGITLTIRTCDWNVFLQDRKNGNFDFAREGWIADFNDPINMIEMFTTTSGNNDPQFGR